MDENEQQADPLADLDEMLADLGWRDGLGRTHYKVVGENGAVVIFPKTAGEGLAGDAQAAAIKEWEDRCLEMHQGQRTIVPEDKPVENTFAQRTDGTLKRGD